LEAFISRDLKTNLHCADLFRRHRAVYVVGGFSKVHQMHTIAVSRNGVEIGTLLLRGLAKAEEVVSGSRRYKCQPKDCVPKKIVRKIADRITFGVTAGHEDDFEWHT